MSPDDVARLRRVLRRYLAPAAAERAIEELQAEERRSWLRDPKRVAELAELVTEPDDLERAVVRRLRRRRRGVG